MKAFVFAVATAIIVMFGAPSARAAPCSYSNPSACGSPGMNQIAVANGGVLNGTFSGAPAFSGTVTFSGPLILSGLSTGTQVSCLGLNSSNQVVLAAGACGSGGGGGLTQLTGGVTAGPGSGSQVATLVLTAGSAVTGILSGVNGGTGIANAGKTLTLGGSLTTTGAATPTLAFGSSSFTYTYPVATANLAYQVGSIVSGNCLQASGTAGGIADAGAACGSGGSGITQLTGGVTAGPGSGSQVGTLVLTAGANVTGILSGVNGGTGIANTGKTLTLGGSLTTTGTATPSLAFGSSSFTYTFPGATANLGYQIGSLVSGHCLQASGTLGGIADAGAACGVSSGANPTATAGPTAINGSATTFMRSDAAPPVQLGTNVIPGLVRGDGATFTIVGGVGSAIGGAATSIVPGTTTIGGATAPCVIVNDATTDMACTAENGTGNVVLDTSPTITSATLVTPALGTPASGVATNLTGTAASLTAGTATAANGLKSATTTVSVSAATAPTTGQALIATSGTTATWQTVSASAASITPGTTTIVGATAPCVISNSATTVMNCIAETGTGSVVLATSPTLVTPALGTPSTLFLTNATGLPIGGITGLGTGVGTAIAIAVGSAGAIVTNGGALGTPSSGVGTNLTGTAAGLTAGSATAANGIKTATTTVSVSGATAPTSGQVLTATGGTAATWQTPGGGGSVSITVDPKTPNIVVTPSPLTGTGVISSASPLISSATSPYIYNGTGTSGTGTQIDNTNLIELSAASAAMTLPQAGTTGFASGVGSMVVFTGSGTATITPNTSTIGGLTAVTLIPHQFVSFGSDGTNYEMALGMPPSGTQNLVLATPNGSTGQPTLRALVTADLPSAKSITPGTTTVVGATAPCVISNSTSTTMNCIAETGTGSVVLATSPTLTTPNLGTPSTLVLTSATGLPVSTGISGLGTGVATALAVNVGSAGAPVVLNGAGGTPSSMTATNLTGTAASLTAGTATAANGLNSATTTVSVSAATAPTTGQALIATSGTTATWQTVSASASSITPGTTTVVGATAPCLIENSTSTTMACAAVGTGVVTALGINVGSAGAFVTFNGAGGTPSSMTGTNITGIPNAAVAAAPLPTPGTSATLVAPRSYYVCTGTCTVTVPVPAAGMEFCVMNDDNISSVITLAAIGSSARYENTARTAYGTAGTGTFVSGGAVGDKVCILGRDSTHFLTVSFNGTWVAS